MAFTGLSLVEITVSTALFHTSQLSDVTSLAADSSRDMNASPFAAAGAGQPAQPQDFNKLLKAERDNLEFSEGLYSWAAKDVENKILRKYGKLPANAI